MTHEAFQSSETPAELTDQNLTCIDCGLEFVWSAGEQQFFYDKGLKNQPKRCRPCKKAKTERIAIINQAAESGIKQKIEVKVKCARCSSETTVPFYPSQGRPVFCRSCYLEMHPDLLTEG